NDCHPVFGSGLLFPPPEVVTAQNEVPTYPGCQQSIVPSTVRVCEIGSNEPVPERTVAVVGDSHATHWFAALDRLGRERNWKVVTYAKSSCPPTVARRILPGEQTDEAQTNCLSWVEDVRRRIAADPSISYVFTSAFSSAYEYVADDDRPLTDPGIDGFQELWATWSLEGKDVFVLKDVPPTPAGARNVPTCLALQPDNRMACSTRRGQIPDDRMAEAAESMIDSRVHLLDMTDRFCDRSVCYPVVGDLIVYRDDSHLSDEFSAALAPYLAAGVDAAVREA
ncbi:MAG TPA: SGNH hydrolase domain-containing protein, partial [Jiangellaceae bacterium]